MDLYNDEEETVVNLYDYYRSHGISDMAAVQMVLHILLTRTYGAESDARQVASEFNVNIPYVIPDNGLTH